MINEIVSLNNSIKRCGLNVQSKHSWITKPARKEGFIVGFDSGGQITAIEQCSSDRMAKMWKFSPDNQKSFPVINFKTPIWESSKNPLEIHNKLNDKDLVKSCDSISKICKDSKLFYKESEKNKLAGRLIDFPNEVLEILNNSDPNLKSLVVLINRLKFYKSDIDSFFEQLSQAAINGCRDGNLQSIELVEKLLFGKWNRNNKKYDKAEISIVFDLADFADFKYRTTDPDLGRHISNVLSQKEDISAEPSTSRCAISGEIAQVETDTFPKPNLPVLGPTFLFSMNKDAPCHRRYGKISSEIFPVSKKLTRELYNSMLYITDEKRKGKTWQTVPSSDNKNPDLLIVYLEDIPDSTINLADLFVETTESEKSEAAFEETARSVCSALKGVPALSRNSFVHVFVLTKIDQGRKQLALNTSFTVENVISGAEKWQFASNNHPPISIILPGKKGEKAITIKPSCPSPASAMRCFQHQWIRNGAAKSRVPGCNLREVYDIFLGEQNEAELSSKRLLTLALQRFSPLFLGIGGAVRSGNWKTFSIDARKTMLTGVSIASILLFKLGYRKENFMKEAAFNVGRLLALSDTLHKEYCNHVRKKDIPPQLIGNAMMPIAIDNPEEGIARLNERLMIYKAWADKVQGEEYRLVKWALGQLGQVARDLADCDLPNRTDDAAKAQMLLGYLARSESKGSKI